MIAAGDLSDYDEFKKADIAESIATDLGISASNVNVTIVAASVRITFEVLADDEPTSTIIQRKLSAAFATPDDATTFFTSAGVSDVSIISVEAPTVITTLVAPPPPTSPSTDAPSASDRMLPIAAIGCIVALIVLAVVMYCFCRKRTAMRRESIPLPPPSTTPSGTEIGLQGDEIGKAHLQKVNVKIETI